MNILILTAKYGMGHYMASSAIKQELESKGAHVEIIDFFDIIFPRINNAIYSTFNFLVSRCSRIYNFLYKFSANTSEAPFKTVIGKRLEGIIEEQDVDIVISTFPACSKYISAYKKEKAKNLKLYTYITDVHVNHEWLTDETDSYFVASNETKSQMMKYNVEEEKINVVGIPVRKEFKEEEPIKKKNEIVVMGGGLGLIPCIERTLDNLSTNKDVHITLLAGKNKKLFDRYYNQYSNITVVRLY